MIAMAVTVVTAGINVPVDGRDRLTSEHFLELGQKLKTKHQFVITEEYIAEAQRLSIAQNRTLKFLYQTWWSWWIPRPVMLGLLVYMLFNHDKSGAALFGFFLILSFAAEWLGRRNLAKARSGVRTINTMTTVTMDEGGIGLDGTNGSSRLKWSALLRPSIYPNGVSIKFSRLSTVWLPDTAIIEGTATDVRHLLSNYVAEKAVQN